MRSVFVILGIILVIGIVVPVAFSGVREYERVSAIDREIAKLRGDVETLERRNALLEERIAYFSSDVYKERLAKEQLGYRRVGEHVLTVAPDAEAPVAPSAQGVALPDVSATDGFLAHVVEWWQRFLRGAR